MPGEDRELNLKLRMDVQEASSLIDSLTAKLDALFQKAASGASVNLSAEGAGVPAGHGGAAGPPVNGGRPYVAPGAPAVNAGTGNGATVTPFTPPGPTGGGSGNPNWINGPGGRRFVLNPRTNEPVWEDEMNQAAPPVNAQTTGSAPVSRGGGRADGGASPVSQFGRYMLAREVIQSGAQAADILIANTATGRDTQWYDWGGLIGTGIGGGLGLLTGTGPFGAAILASAGGAIGNTASNALKLREQTAAAAQGFSALTGMPSGYAADMLSVLPIPEQLMASTLAGRLSYSMGENAPWASVDIAARLHGALGKSDPNYTQAKAELTALTQVADAQKGRWLNEAYSPDRALMIGLSGNPNAVSGYIHATGGLDTAAGVMQRAGDVQLLMAGAGTDRATIDLAATNIQRVTARGGNAAQIGRAIEIEQGAFQNAERGLSMLLERVRGLAAQGPEAAKVVNDITREIATLRAASDIAANQAATIAATEAVDISGTRLTSATAGAQIGLMTAGRGADIGGIFAPTIAASGANITTLEAQVTRPNLRPEQRRAYQRQLDAARVEDITRLQGALTAQVTIPATLAGLDAGYSAAYAHAELLNVSDPVAASTIRGQVATSTERSAGALYNRYRAFEGAGFDAVRVAGARNDWVSERNRALDLAVSAARFAWTPAQSAAMNAAGLSAGFASRNDGPMAALPYLQRQLGMWEGADASINAIYRNNVGRIGAVAAGALRAEAYNERSRSILGLRGELAGMDGVSVATGGAVEAAGFQYNLLFSSPFVRGNRMNAATGLLAAEGRAMDEMAAWLPNLDPAGQRAQRGRMYELGLQMQGQRESLNAGWAARLGATEWSAPGRAGMVGVSSRDYLAFNPGNRLFGYSDYGRWLGDQDQYATTAATGAAARPGDYAAQAVRVVVELSEEAKRLFSTRTYNDPTGRVMARKAAG